MNIQFIVPEPKRLMPRDYLGDSVYATFDGCGIVLTTENGMGAGETIYLEMEVIAALNRFVERIKTQSAPHPPPDAADHPASADDTTATSADPSSG